MKTRSSGFAAANLAFVLALVSCLAAGYLYFQWHQLSQEKQGFEAARIQLQDQIAVLEKDLEAARAEQANLKSKLDSAEGAAKSQAQALDESKKQIADFKSQLAQLMKDQDALKKLVEKAKAAEMPLPATTASIETGGTPANAASATRAVAIGMNTSGAMKVKTINRKFNFVVFDRMPGKDIQVGDTFKAERDGAWVADLKIQKTYDQFVSAEIRKESDQNPLQIGDEVKPGK